MGPARAQLGLLDTELGRAGPALLKLLTFLIPSSVAIVEVGVLVVGEVVGHLLLLCAHKVAADSALGNQYPQSFPFDGRRTAKVRNE